MITFKELIGDKTVADIDHSTQLHLEELLKRMNIVRAAYGKPMVVTSGLRTREDQIRIYSARGISFNKIPFNSAHISGEACDILDLDGKLLEFLKSSDILEKADLYCEVTNGPWQHFQIRSFGSYKKGGTRWFKP